MFLTDSNRFRDFFRTLSKIRGGAFCEKSSSALTIFLKKLNLRCFHFTTLYLSLHYKFSTKPTNFFQVKMQQWWKQVFLKLLIDSWISAFSSNIENVRSVLRSFKSTSPKIHCALCFFCSCSFFQLLHFTRFLSILFYMKYKVHNIKYNWNKEGFGNIAQEFEVLFWEF